MNEINLNIKCTEIIEYVIFKFMTCQYNAINRGISNKWLLGPAINFQEYIIANRIYLVNTLKHRKYRKLLLKYRKIRKKYDEKYDGDNYVLLELNRHILDPIYHIFPDLATFTDRDFSSEVINVVRSKLIEIATEIDTNKK